MSDVEYIEYATLDDHVMQYARVRTTPVDVRRRNLISIALAYLDPRWLVRHRLGHIWRQPMAGKAARLIVHDRILNGEVRSRGLPPFFIPMTDAQIAEML